jgi:glycosyltransferase involved in cell wall biosynthesis
LTEFTFTVFTATFNRAHTLHRAYEDLCQQTYRDFEWLIVDDGSTDDTASLVGVWAKEAPFTIRYVHQENRGKHVAFNRGVELARGKLFLSLDSDDGCVRQALERFKWHWDQISPTARDAFSGVAALSADQFGHLNGNRFPSDVFDSDSLESKYRYKIAGDKWGFSRIEVLKQFPFPEPPGLKFVPESVVWFKIARVYRIRYVNEVLLTYWTSDSPGTRFSNSGLSKTLAAGLALLHRNNLNDNLRWFRYAPISFLRSSLDFSRFSLDSGTGILKQRRQLGATAQAFWFASLPFGLGVSLWDRYRNRPLR